MTEQRTNMPEASGDHPGNATRLSGDLEAANREIGDPGGAKNANREIGDPGGAKNANREIGGPRGAKNANREIGGPRDSGGSEVWHSRGYLPHFDGLEITQHVTFHLADSLPREVLGRLEEELKELPLDKQDVERRKRIEAWIDGGHGSCILREPAVARMVEESLLFFDNERYRLLAWVVMPNHVHVLFQPIYGWTVSKIVASWKKFTARGISDYRKSDPGNTSGNATRLSGDIQSSQAANQEIGGPGGVKSANREIGDPGVPGESRIWHREYWDRFIRNNRHFAQAIEYIHYNPVKAGLVVAAEDWPWSSAQFTYWETDSPGNANRLSGDIQSSQAANREIGGPGGVKSANREIGGPGSLP